MSSNDFNTSTLEALQTLTQWDTPTICNGLELVCPERRACGFTTEPLVCLRPDMPAVIGIAKTARIRASAPSTEPVEANKKLRLQYYRYVADCPLPTLVVIEDLDATPGFGAFWGEVNTHIHRGLGTVGCVTNGSIRDLPDSATGFQLLAGRVGPSHAHVHLTDYGNEVTVQNMTVNDGDIVHMDLHGAVIVPADAVEELPAAIERIARRESVIIEASKSADFNIDVLEKAMASADEIH